MGHQYALGQQLCDGAGKMPEAREWAAELVRLLRAHDLVT